MFRRWYLQGLLHCSVACSDTIAVTQADLVDASSKDAALDARDASSPSSEDAALAPAPDASAGRPQVLAMDPGCSAELADVLTTIPSTTNGPGILIFQPVAGACEPLGPSEVILQNTSAGVVELRTLTVNDPNFSVSAPDLPRNLRPNERMRLELSLLDRTPSGEHAAFIVAGIANGCVAFRILGKAVDAAEDGVVTHTPLAMDFGGVPAGTVSAPRKFTFVAQSKTASDERHTLGPFSVSPAAFSIDGAPTEIAVTSGCRRFELSVRFAAPSTPGLVRGHLTWELIGPQFAAFAIIDIVGNSE